MSDPDIKGARSDKEKEEKEEKKAMKQRKKAEDAAKVEGNIKKKKQPTKR